MKKARRESAPRLARHRQELRSAAAAADAAAVRPPPRGRATGGQQGRHGPDQGAKPDGRDPQPIAGAGTGAAHQHSQAAAKWTPRGDTSSRSQQSNAAGRGKGAPSSVAAAARVQALQGHSAALDTVPAAKGAAPAQQRFRPPSKLSGAAPPAAAGRPGSLHCQHLRAWLLALKCSRLGQ